MKYFIIAIAFIVSASTYGQRYVSETFADTLTDAGTVTFNIDDLIYDEGVLTWYFAADSVSGTGNGTGYVQVAYGNAGSDWRNVDTITLSGANTTNYYTGDLTGIRTRITITGSGTSVSALRGYCIFKRKQ